MKVVVVGASGGLGRCIGVGLAQRGAQVALLARRLDRLKDAAGEAGDTAYAIECDATQPTSCANAIAEAAAAMDGIDGLVYAAGVGPLARIEDVTPDEWRLVFETNVIGASIVTAAAIPYLKAASGAALYLSSVSASETPPWPGLGSYAVSKAALDKLVEAWRAEHPGVGFTRVVVGDCGGGLGDAASSFAGEWDGELASELMPGWFAKGYLAGTLLPVERLVEVADVILRGGASDSIRSIVVAPRPLA